MEYPKKMEPKRKIFWPLPPRPVVMGILNVTPDSFYDGGRYTQLDAALKHVEEMVHAGVDIVDIGGESSRPGAQPISVQEELDRVVPVIEAIRERFDVPLSVDTTKARVAEDALRHGAHWINDISALRFDSDMVHVASRYQAPVVLMHMQGTPQTMQKKPHYQNVVEEVFYFLEERVAFAHEHGVEAVLVDPGIGFGKTLEHNLKLLHHIERFTSLGPVLIGVSRKSYIGMLGSGAYPQDRLEGTLATAGWCWLHGVRVFRVHDVEAHIKFFRVLSAIKEIGS